MGSTTVQVPYVSPIVMLGPIGVLTLGSATGAGGVFYTALGQIPTIPPPNPGGGGWGLSLIGALLYQYHAPYLSPPP